MAYSDMELSVDDAKPIELYEIVYGLSRWYYTSADRNITYDSKVYKAVPCSHGDVEQAISGEKAQLMVMFPHDAEFGEVFRVQPPSEVVSLTLMVQNYLSPGDYITLWRGRVLNVDWKFPNMEVLVENIFTSMNRVGLQRRYSAQCPHALYSVQCGVNANLYRDSSFVIAIDGTGITVQSVIGTVNNYYAGGYVTWINNANGNIEKRMIVTSNGTTGVLQLTGPTVGLSVSQAISMFAGCDHTISTCSSKFNNSDNCGAIPYIPSSSPFGGSSLY